MKSKYIVVTVVGVLLLGVLALIITSGNQPPSAEAMKQSSNPTAASTFTSCPENNTEGIVFRDTNFEKAVRTQINQLQGPITKEEALKVTELMGIGLGIKSIEDLQHFKKIGKLYLGMNQIADISPLEHLKELQDLNLMDNQIIDISVLKHLPQLQAVDLGKNPVKDISALGGLKNLKGIGLKETSIRDFSPLQTLQELVFLRLSNNQIEHTEFLEGLRNISILDLQGNRIQKVDSLKELKKLKTLNLNGNPLKSEHINVLKDALSNCQVQFGE